MDGDDMDGVVDIMAVVGVVVITDMDGVSIFIIFFRTI
jgi:hypothetical protein